MRERGKCDEGKRGRPIVRRGQSQITQQEKGCGVSSSLCKRAKENAMIVLAFQFLSLSVPVSSSSVSLPLSRSPNKRNEQKGCRKTMCGI